jgi:hypothetical protein
MSTLGEGGCLFPIGVNAANSDCFFKLEIIVRYNQMWASLIIFP